MSTEPLDLVACQENLDHYAAIGDACSCRDIAVFALREVEQLRRGHGALRKALADLLAAHDSAGSWPEHAAAWAKARHTLDTTGGDP